MCSLDQVCEWLEDGMNGMGGSSERPMPPASCQASNPPTWEHVKLTTTYPLPTPVEPVQGSGAPGVPLRLTWIACLPMQHTSPTIGLFSSINVWQRAAKI